MTEQVPDTVELEGKTWSTWNTPLDGYFIERGMDTAIVEREFLCSACHRGYVAGWVVEGGLLRIKRLTRFGGEGDLFDRLFGRRKKSVVAVWFTGNLYLYESEEPWPEHGLQLQVLRGRVTQKKLVQAKSMCGA